MRKLSVHQEILACTQCESDLPLGVNPILQINSKAKILIAGQAPGIKVHESGIPFNDASGERLRAWLDVSKEQFYNPEIFAIVPMAFCYPGKGKSGDLPPPRICAELWREKVLKALLNIQLHLLIGAYAQSYHLPQYKEGLTDLIKTWQKNPEQFNNFVPLPHPSPRNNIWLKKNPWFEKDCLPTIQARVKTLL